MATGSKLNPECNAEDRLIAIANISLQTFTETDARYAGDPATSVLAIDVIAQPGNTGAFHFVTLVLVIDQPSGARFVDHSSRNPFHWDVLADPDVNPFADPDPGVLFWTEGPRTTTALRVREDMTALWSGPGNGRTYYVGVAGLAPDEGLRFTALAKASTSRIDACAVVVDDLQLGQGLPGRLDGAGVTP